MVVSIKSPRGGNRSAVWHWVFQRLSGALLIPLSFWFVWGVLPAIIVSPSTALEWFKTSSHTIGALLWTGLIFYHGVLGIQVIVEDYISCQKLRTLSLFMLQVLSFGAAVVAFFQLIRLSAGG